ncbi:MAG: vWA domain-containing protein [Flavobacterium sp.]|jgi:Ca-activated chloride channel family protein|uniref:vWA domain-containing protein n=1 Tax=Flavobacterium sp. TaxID=239 RepID=UPI0022BD9775|nr:VWA domain-containing protein [Flavobacterium sp.]MCZ8169664.1 VWA domain-containing protein [Flavobacterium sp.]MCZ8297961.1 VWA domain-containing protein [Flavobacterium sp.]
MDKVSFLHPEFLLLLALLPIAGVWLYRSRKHQSVTLTLPAVAGLESLVNWKVLLKPYLIVFRLVALALIIIGLARPRTVDVSNQTKTTRGIDIVMAVDLSSSMLAKDLEPNRMEALKKVADRFVDDRPNDRIGIVVYAGEAYTKVPVTTDKSIVKQMLQELNYDPTVDDGTGIGMGLATAVNRLKESKAKSRVIILLTDGINNAGFIEPETAADLAKEYGIKVYTIGLGSNGMAPFPVGYTPDGTLVYRNMKVEIDEKLMKSIAKKTGGKYFRATSNSRLEAIYNEINQMETTEIEELRYYDYEEQFRPFALLALVLLVLEVGLRQTLYRSFI